MSDPVTRPVLPLSVAAADAGRGDRRLWLGYAGLCLLCWLLYAIAGTEWLRGSWRIWEAAYEASWNLVPAMLLGTLVLPWVRWLQARPWPMPRRLAAHALGALDHLAHARGLEPGRGILQGQLVELERRAGGGERGKRQGQRQREPAHSLPSSSARRSR